MSELNNEIVVAIAQALRKQRELMEARNEYAIGDDIPEIGLLAVIAIDTTEALRGQFGNDVANLFVNQAHPRNATDCRKVKARVNKQHEAAS